MFLLLTLILSIYVSAESFTFVHEENYSYQYCNTLPKNPLNAYFCKRYFDFFRNDLKPISSNDKCTDCENMENKLRNEKESNEVLESFIKETLSKFCETFKDKIRHSCEIWIEINVKEIQEIARRSIEQKTFCHNFMNCKPVEDTLKFTPNDEINFYPVCKTCVQLVESFKHKVLKNVDFKVISETLDIFFCQNAPARFYSLCRTFTYNTSNKVIKILDQFQNASKFCSDIKLCPNTPINKFSNNPYPFTYLKETPSGGICKLCNNITTTQFQQISNSITIDYWKVLGYVILCDDVTDVDICKSFVDKMVVPVQEKIQQIFNKESLCHEMLQCPIKSTGENFFFDLNLFYRKIQLPKNNGKCLICLMLSTLLEKHVNDSNTRDIIEFIYKKRICERTKQNFKECIKYMISELPLTIKKVSTYLRNGLLCINICSIPKTNESNSKNKIIKCSFCKKILTDLKSSINIFYGDKELVKASIIHICEKMPKETFRKCNNFIKFYRLRLTTLLMKDESTVNICEDVNQCSKQENDYSLFNYKEKSPYLYSYYQESYHPNFYYDKIISFPYHFFSDRMSYPYEFFKSRDAYPLKFFHENEFNQSYFLKYFSSPYQYFGKEMPYKYFWSFFPYNKYASYFSEHFTEENEKSKECPICTTHENELRELKNAYLKDPTFYFEYIIELCSYDVMSENQCLRKMNNYIEKNLSIFRRGKSITKLCQTSCNNLKKLIFLCFYKDRKYCNGNGNEKKIFFL